MTHDNKKIEADANTIAEKIGQLCDGFCIITICNALAIAMAQQLNKFPKCHMQSMAGQILGYAENIHSQIRDNK